MKIQVSQTTLLCLLLSSSPSSLAFVGPSTQARSSSASPIASRTRLAFRSGVDRELPTIESSGMEADKTTLRPRSLPVPIRPEEEQQQQHDDPSAGGAVTSRASSASPGGQPAVRKKWGVDNKVQDEYWYDQRIHSLGNRGFTGALHAAIAPMATWLIDRNAYHGVNIRLQVAEELSCFVTKGKARVVDLCCGVGMSTRALAEAFPDAEAVIGLDTSPQMLAMADFINGHLAVVKPLWERLMELWEAQSEMLRQCCAGGVATFVPGNAEDTKLPSRSFDLVTIMYAFHEAPKIGRDRILAEARRLLQPGGSLAVVDITTDYTPSKEMLAGEPYVIEYQENIHSQLGSFEGFLPAKYKVLVPGHVGLWLLQRTPALVAA